LKCMGFVNAGPRLVFTYIGHSLSHVCFGLPPRSEFIQECECPVPFDMPIDEDEIRKTARESDDVRLVMTIPGVDFYLASLISSFTGDVNRFPSDNHLASFLGIIPATRDSTDIGSVSILLFVCF